MATVADGRRRYLANRSHKLAHSLAVVFAFCGGDVELSLTLIAIRHLSSLPDDSRTSASVRLLEPEAVVEVKGNIGASIKSNFPCETKADRITTGGQSASLMKLEGSSHARIL